MNHKFFYVTSSVKLALEAKLLSVNVSKKGWKGVERLSISLAVRELKSEEEAFVLTSGLKPGKPSLLFAFITISFAANSRSFLSAANNCIIQTDKTQCFLSLTLDPHGSQRESATVVEKSMLIKENNE